MKGLCRLWSRAHHSLLQLLHVNLIKKNVEQMDEIPPLNNSSDTHTARLRFPSMDLLAILIGLARLAGAPLVCLAISVWF
jgi:hypothetical protein